MDILFENIVNDSYKLEGGKELIVYDFGENKDLELHIWKDEDFNMNESEEYSNMVDIVTLDKDKIAVDDAISIFVPDGDLYDELDRIYHYRDFETL